MSVKDFNSTTCYNKLNFYSTDKSIFTELYNLHQVMKKQIKMKEVLFLQKRRIACINERYPELQTRIERIRSQYETKWIEIEKPNKFGRFVLSPSFVIQIETSHLLRPASRRPSQSACTCPAASYREVWLEIREKKFVIFCHNLTEKTNKVIIFFQTHCFKQQNVKITIFQFFCFLSYHFKL